MSKTKTVGAVASAVGLLAVLGACATSGAEQTKQAGEDKNVSARLADPSCEETDRPSAVCMEFANTGTWLFSGPGVADEAALFKRTAYTNFWYGKDGDKEVWTPSGNNPKSAYPPSEIFGEEGTTNGVARAQARVIDPRSWGGAINALVTYEVDDPESSLAGKGIFSASAAHGQNSGVNCDGGTYLVCTTTEKEMGSRTYGGYAIANSPLSISVNNRLTSSQGTMAELNTTSPSNLLWDTKAFTSLTRSKGQPVTIAPESSEAMGGYRASRGTTSWSGIYAVQDGSLAGIYIQLNVSITNQDMSGGKTGAPGSANVDSSTCDVISPTDGLKTAITCLAQADLGSGWNDQNEISFTIDSTV